MNSCYSVAGLEFCIEGEQLNAPFYINYAPFRLEKRSGSPLLFKMVFTKLPPMTIQPSRVYHSELGEYHIYIGEKTCDIVCRLASSARLYRLSANRQWSYIEVDMDFLQIEDFMVLNDFIMFAFIYSSAFYNTVLLHASCLRYKESGVAFMGASGVGKSTHSHLWLKYIEGAILLNDDQPAVRLLEGKPYICGTPWSGKTACYRNQQAELKIIFAMEQAQENKMTRLSPLGFFQQLLASCSLIREDEKSFDKITKTLSAIVKHVQAFQFKNRPDKTAVELSFYTLFGNNE